MLLISGLTKKLTRGHTFIKKRKLVGCSTLPKVARQMAGDSYQYCLGLQSNTPSIYSSISLSLFFIYSWSRKDSVRCGRKYDLRFAIHSPMSLSLFLIPAELFSQSSPSPLVSRPSLPLALHLLIITISCTLFHFLASSFSTTFQSTKAEQRRISQNEVKPLTNTGTGNRRDSVLSHTLFNIYMRPRRKPRGEVKWKN